MAGDGRLTVDAGRRHAWTAGEVLDAVDPGVGFRPGTSAPAIEVPAPTADESDDDPVTCVAAFRVTGPA